MFHTFAPKTNERMNLILFPLNLKKKLFILRKLFLSKLDDTKCIMSY